jgi:hypothetical protein
VEGTPPHGHGVVGSLLDELDQLRARVEELDRQRHLPDPDTGRATDAQVLINFAALAQFARPEHLPPFERLLIKNRSPQPAMSPGPWELPPTPAAWNDHSTGPDAATAHAAAWGADGGPDAASHAAERVPEDST